MKTSEFRNLIREEIYKALKEAESNIKEGWLHAWNPVTKKYKMFPNAAVALQNGFIFAINADDVETIEPEELEDWTLADFTENGWYILKK